MNKTSSLHFLQSLLFCPSYFTWISVQKFTINLLFFCNYCSLLNSLLLYVYSFFYLKTLKCNLTVTTKLTLAFLHSPVYNACYPFTVFFVTELKTHCVQTNQTKIFLLCVSVLTFSVYSLVTIGTTFVKK